MSVTFEHEVVGQLGRRAPPRARRVRRRFVALGLVVRWIAQRKVLSEIGHEEMRRAVFDARSLGQDLSAHFRAPHLGDAFGQRQMRDTTCTCDA